VISNQTHPVEWALLLHELDDAQEHLKTLLDEMGSSQEFSEIDYRIQLGHIFSHLNRAWNSRCHDGDWSDSDFEKYSKFPADLSPV
jgi:hypothetical protein